MPPKRGLGRGLDALFTTTETPAAGVTHLPVSVIRRNPRQPRLSFNPVELEELVNSIREHGVIQPLVVAQGQAVGQYILIAGERRLEASKIAGLPSVPVIVREASDQQLLELALVENIQRADLGPLETAQAYKHLVEDFNLSHEEIAVKVGKKRATVSNTLRLLKLPQRIQEGLAKTEIDEGHARALLALPTAQAQLAAFDTVVRNQLNTRQTEELVRRLQGHKETRPARPAKHAESEAIAARMREALGTKVALKRGRKGGTIVIHFYSDEELNAIAEAILGE
jgi:ParB family transcriptional regulator, chromosome partitioning protein